MQRPRPFAALVALLVVGALAGSADALSTCAQGFNGTAFVQAPLPYAFDALEPRIDNETMTIHFKRHHAAYINNANGVLARYPALRGTPLSTLVRNVGTRNFTATYGLPPNETFVLRNNVGGHWNHAFFWKTLTPAAGANSSSDALSDELKSLIAAAFPTNGTSELVAKIQAAGLSVFGSGWAWLAYYPTTNSSTSYIGITTTPNQDNPLMLAYKAPGSSRTGIPLLGVDVWEHAYYLKYRNVRASYLAAWAGLINWNAVQANYEAAKEWELEALYCGWPTA